MSIAAIVIATARIPGSADPLALAPWHDDEARIGYVLAQIVEAGVRDIEVVIGGEGSGAIFPFIYGDTIEAVIDPAASPDVASGLRVGATAVPRGTTAALIIDVAQPSAAPALRALLDAHAAAGAMITRSSDAPERGMPYVVALPVLEALRNVSDLAALDALLARFAAETHVVN